MLETKQIEPHSKGCWVTPEYEYPWCLTGDRLRRNKIGGRSRGGENWIVFVCNNPQCTAKLIVREYSLIKLLPRRVK